MNETFVKKVRENFTVEEVTEMLSLQYEDYGIRVTNVLFDTNGNHDKAFKKTAKYLNRILQSEIILSKLLSVKASELIDIHNRQFSEWRATVKYEPVYSKGKCIGMRPVESFVIK